MPALFRRVLLLSLTLFRRVLLLSLTLFRSGLAFSPALFCLGALAAQVPVQVLAIAAAADLRPAMAELQAAFEAGQPGVKLQASFGASGSLAAMIQQGAPYDLYLSADLGFPQRLAAAGLARGPVFSYATGSLALWLRRDLGLDVGRDGLKVLDSPAIKHIALANPALAPYGRSAKAALEQTGRYQALTARLVFGESLTQAGQFLQSGAAEAGFISSAQARLPGLAETGAVWIVPQELYPVQRQGGVVLNRSNKAALALAEAFRDFLVAGPGRAILQRQGFGSP